MGSKNNVVKEVPVLRVRVSPVSPIFVTLSYEWFYKHRARFSALKSLQSNYGTRDKRW